MFGIVEEKNSNSEPAKEDSATDSDKISLEENFGSLYVSNETFFKLIKRPIDGEQ